MSSCDDPSSVVVVGGIKVDAAALKWEWSSRFALEIFRLLINTDPARPMTQRRTCIDWTLYKNVSESAGVPFKDTIATENPLLPSLQSDNDFQFRRSSTLAGWNDLDFF